jgi:hypothetical protein
MRFLLHVMDNNHHKLDHEVEVQYLENKFLFSHYLEKTLFDLKKHDFT